MFLVFMIGTALSNQILFGYYIESYSSFIKAFFTTMKALQGKIPYEDIESIMNAGIFGVVFGVSYVGILVYIIFHLILALLFALAEYIRKVVQVRHSVGSNFYMFHFCSTPYELQASFNYRYLLTATPRVPP